MSLFSYALRDMLKAMRTLESQMRLTEEMFSPTSSNLKIPKFSFELNEDFFKRDAILQDKDKFQVKVDVQEFKPEEIVIKTLDGNSIQIEAKHEEKHDGGKGFISRQLIRKFVLPQGHDIKNAVSSLSSDGILTITARRKVEEIAEKEIPIKHIESGVETTREKQKYQQ